MMPQQHKSRRDVVAEHILNLCKISAKRKGCRVKKLEDTSAREGVINAAAWRLLLNQQRFGNIRDYIEGDFWFEESDARNDLIYRALDAERKAYLRASAASGGIPANELTEDDSARNDYLARFSYGCTDFKLGQGPGVIVPANSVLDEIEREADTQEFEAKEAAEYYARKQIEAEENEKLREARNAYGETLTNIRHRRALYLICSDPKASNSTVAAQVGMRSIKGIKPNTVRKIREKLTELANGILTRSPEDLYMEELERLADIAKAEAELRRAESRLHRAQWALTKSAAELAAFRAFAAPLCEALGMSVDDLLGPTITPKPST